MKTQKKPKRKTMITKDNIFAEDTENRDANNVTTFKNGMTPQTVARAEQVNMSGFMSDRDLYVVCQEIKNLMALYDASPNNSYAEGQQNQLATMFRDLVKQGTPLTGVYQPFSSVAPTQSGSVITFPNLWFIFNSSVYYGEYMRTHAWKGLAPQTLSATSSWVDGVHFIYAYYNAGSVTLGHQTDPVSAADGASKCMLGSVFVINGQFQAGSWKYQPWLTVTSIDTRQSPTAYTKGGFVSAATATTLQMGALEIKDEGINFDSNQLLPSIATVQAKNPYTYKFLYPDYDPSQSDLTTLDTTHVYNMTDGTWDDVSSQSTASAPKYMVMVPCIAPTGQTLMIPAMSYVSGGTYTQLFDTQEAAINSVYSLPYELGNVAKRAIYLGQSLIVRVGATDLTDPLQMISVGMLPQALAGFSSASGQAGGGITTYRPMPAITWDGYTTITCQNNAKNIVVDNGSAISVTLPTPTSGIINQLEVEYVCNGSALTFTNANWWYGSQPTTENGKTYLYIFEYVGGTWYGGVLQK